MSRLIAWDIESGQDEDGTYWRRENGVEVSAVHFTGVPHGSTPLHAIEVEKFMGGETRGIVTFKGGAPKAIALSAISALPVLVHYWPKGRRPGHGEMYTFLVVASQIRPAAVDDGIGVSIAFNVISPITVSAA